MSDSTVVKPRFPNISTFFFWGFHVLAVAGVAYYGWSWSGFGLAMGLYFLRMFFVTAGYHRYFSHRTFKTSRWFQAVMAFGAETTAQKGVLWWSAHHRHHHKYSDQPEDIHSVKQRGFYWAHVGWTVSDEYADLDMSKVPDLAKYRELVWLDRYWAIPVALLGAACLGFGGVHGLLWGFLVSTVLLWHGTFTINSLTHVFGRRRYETTDDSRNHWLFALITMGEGWHNNHHYYQSCTRQGFFWWELDMTYLILRGLQTVGIVWDIREPPARVVAGLPPRREQADAEPEPEIRRAA